MKSWDRLADCELCGVATREWNVMTPKQAEALGRPRFTPDRRYLCGKCDTAVDGWVEFLVARLDRERAEWLARLDVGEG